MACGRGFDSHHLHHFLNRRTQNFLGSFYNFKGTAISTIQIEKILETGECETIEFKSSLSLVKEGLLAFTAMLNSNHGQGIVVFGVEDSGQVLGIEHGNKDTILKNLAQKVDEFIEPRPSLTVQILSHDGHKVLILTGARQSNVPYYEFRGRAYIRIGTTSRQMSLEEKEGLRNSRNWKSHNGPWLCQSCNALTMQMQPHPSYNNYQCSCGGQLVAASL